MLPSFIKTFNWEAFPTRSVIAHSMKTKAQSLLALSGKLEIFNIPDIHYFTVKEWLENREEVLKVISCKFDATEVAVRSSVQGEDGDINSHAGVYSSVLNVFSGNVVALTNAIENVISSYGNRDILTGRDEVIVQKMITKTAMSGVVFTHDCNTGAPYYVINYDDISGLTNTVTSGDGIYSNRTIFIHRSAASKIRSKRFSILISAIRELELLLGSQFLDIEFAIGLDATPYLFQVRKITTQPNWNRAVSLKIDSELAGIENFLKSRFLPIPGVYGETTVFGQMPDWNPAEMIGRAPRALAFSLYKLLITDDAWRIARDKMGYSTPLGYPLMVSLSGQPFIDVRLSLHSFLPKNTPEEIAQKLVNAWICRLREHPEFHDKVEFEIAITAYSFDIDKKIENLIGPTLSNLEKKKFKDLLQRQTKQIISAPEEWSGSLSAAMSEIEALSKSKIIESNYEVDGDVYALYPIIYNCINQGTIPFAVLARHGFIARVMLRSLIECGIFSENEVSAFQSGIHTVASDLVFDINLLSTNNLAKLDFMKKYGHLRPGTYDIMSPRYDQLDELGSSTPTHLKLSNKENCKFAISEDQENKLNNLLEEHGFLGVSAVDLMDYIELAIKGREYGKFVFTKSVSAILEIVANFGQQHNLSREEMSHIPIDTIIKMIESSAGISLEDQLRKQSQINSELHTVSSAIRLPQILFDVAGAHVVPFQVSQPNFITNKKITAMCIFVAVDSEPIDLCGRIVMIENADPGFDWIFAKGIGGLITKYGGINSHMAIRCAEFGIPAAIGCGEQRFEALLKTQKIHLDCTAGILNIVH